MDLRLSRRIAALAPSSTTSAGRKAKALAASGVDVVDLSIGEPDFATPAHVGRAGVRAIENGRTKYTDVAGEAALRDAIAAKYAREQNAKVGRDSIIVTAGAKQAVFNVCMALFDEGDDVALFSPYWVSFPEMVRLTGARPLFVETSLEDGWHARARLLEGAGVERVRGVILNSPNNPTGAVVDAAELSRIVEWCAARQAWLIYDETYDRFLYDGRSHASAAARRPDYERVVVTGAASKTFAMTGWRLGWAIGPPELITALASFQSHTTSNASSISQAAALEALTDLDGSAASVDDMLSHYETRRTGDGRGPRVDPERPVSDARGRVLRFRRRFAPLRAQGRPGLGRLLRPAPPGGARGGRAGRRLRRRPLRPVLLRDEDGPNPRGRAPDRGVDGALASTARAQGIGVAGAAPTGARRIGAGAERARSARWSRNSR